MTGTMTGQAFETLDQMLHFAVVRDGPLFSDRGRGADGSDTVGKLAAFLNLLWLIPSARSLFFAVLGALG